jgi:hypothetical protein
MIALGIILGVAATDLYFFNQYLSLMEESPTYTPLGHFIWLLIGHPANGFTVQLWVVVLTGFSLFFITSGLISLWIKFKRSQPGRIR